MCDCDRLPPNTNQTSHGQHTSQQRCRTGGVAHVRPSPRHRHPLACSRQAEARSPHEPRSALLRYENSGLVGPTFKPKLRSNPRTSFSMARFCPWRSFRAARRVRFSILASGLDVDRSIEPDPHHLCDPSRVICDQSCWFEPPVQPSCVGSQRRSLEDQQMRAH